MPQRAEGLVGLEVQVVRGRACERQKVSNRMCRRCEQTVVPLRPSRELPRATVIHPCGPSVGITHASPLPAWLAALDRPARKATPL